MNFHNTTSTAPRLTLETVRVPTDWSMFTPAGNRSLTAKAATALRKILALKVSGNVTTAKVNRILVTYITSWERSEKSKGMSEAGDTAVRECVGDWHDWLYKLALGDSFGVYEAWEKNRNAAYKAKVNRKSTAAKLAA